MRSLILLAIPLILGMGAQSLMLFTDRLYLNRLGADALAASFPATVFGHLCQCFFIAAGGFVATVAAQRFGAGDRLGAGRAVWPALWVCLLGGVLNLLLVPALPAIYGILGSEPAVQEHMVTLGTWFVLGCLPVSIIATVGGFASGLGRTGVASALQVTVLLVNAGLNAFLAFGPPAMGVRGIAIGSFCAASLVAAAALLWLWSGTNRRVYGTTLGPRWSWPELRAYLAVAAPQGGRFFTEIISWTVFGFAIGTLGTVANAANGVAISWNLLTFIPMMGLSNAIAVAVGQAIGAGRPEEARAVVRRGLALEAGYAAVVALALVCFPGPLLAAFPPSGVDAATAGEIERLTRTLFLVAALWGAGDACNMAFSGGLAGSGDTRWQFLATIVAGLFLQWIPLVVVVSLPATRWHAVGIEPVVAAWGVSLAFVLGMGALMGWRWHSGAWQRLGRL